jgi:hypothetical protein
MEIIDEKGRSISASGWKKRKVLMVSLDGVVHVLETSAHTV